MVRIGRAAVLADDLGHRLRADQVVEDRGAGLLLEHARRPPARWWPSRRGRSPCSSTTKTRSASPSKAKPTSAPTSRTRAHRSRWFSGWIGSAGWFGNVPSSSRVQDLEVERAGPRTRRDHEAAHAVGGVGHDLERAGTCATSTNERTWSAKAPSRSSGRRRPGAAPAGDARSAASALTRSRPVSAPDRAGRRRGRT